MADDGQNDAVLITYGPDGKGNDFVRGCFNECPGDGTIKLEWEHDQKEERMKHPNQQKAVRGETARRHIETFLEWMEKEKGAHITLRLDGEQSTMQQLLDEWQGIDREALQVERAEIRDETKRAWAGKTLKGQSGQ